MVSLTDTGEHNFRAKLFNLGMTGILNTEFRYEYNEIHIKTTLFEETVPVFGVEYEYNNMAFKYAEYCYYYLVKIHPEILL